MLVNYNRAHSNSGYIVTSLQKLNIGLMYGVNLAQYHAPVKGGAAFVEIIMFKNWQTTTMLKIIWHNKVSSGRLLNIGTEIYPTATRNKSGSKCMHQVKMDVVNRFTNALKETIRHLHP